MCFHRERLIACNPRPGIADVRLIDPKGHGLQKQNKKVHFVVQSITSQVAQPCDRFSPAVRIELGENGGDVELGGVKRDSQTTCDRFVGGAICQTDRAAASRPVRRRRISRSIADRLSATLTTVMAGSPPQRATAVSRLPCRRLWPYRSETWKPWFSTLLSPRMSDARILLQLSLIHVSNATSRP